MTFKVDCLLGNALPEPRYPTATLEKEVSQFQVDAWQRGFNPQLTAFLFRPDIKDHRGKAIFPLLSSFNVLIKQSQSPESGF